MRDIQTCRLLSPQGGRGSKSAPTSLQRAVGDITVGFQRRHQREGAQHVVEFVLAQPIDMGGDAAQLGAQLGNSLPLIV